MNRIILSCDGNPTYSWFVPLCRLMWRAVARFDVSCIYVGPVAPWLLARAREAGVSVYECEPPPGVGVPAAAQLIRLFSYCLPGMAPDDYLLAVDADAWPIADVFAPSGAAIDLLYPDACDRAETPYFPIGYIGARAAQWRAFMCIPHNIGGPSDALAAMFAADPTLAGGHTGWNYDETLVTCRIKKSGAWPRGVHIRRRSGDPPRDRIDRSAWPAVPERRGMIDAHLLRPGWTAENWPRLPPLLAQCLDASALEWADQYRAQSVVLLGE